MRLLYVPLSAEMLDRLCQIAERERRAPREQAAYLLERALEPLPSSGPAWADASTGDAGFEQVGASLRRLAQQPGAAQKPNAATVERRSALDLTGYEAGDEPGS